MELESRGLASRETHINPVEETQKDEEKEVVFDARAHLEQIASNAKESVLKSEHFLDFVKDLHPDNTGQVISIINRNISHPNVEGTLKLVIPQIKEMLSLANGSEQKNDAELTKEILALARQIRPLVDEHFTQEKLLGNINGDSKDLLEKRITDLESSIEQMPNTQEKVLLRKGVTKAKMEIKKTVN
jgi:hypothetical protein